MSRAMRSTKLGATLVAAGSVAALVAVSAGAGSVAAQPVGSSGDVSTTVRKSVSLTADPSGTVSSAAMVTQLSAEGQGQGTVTVPIGASTVRNLDGFGAPPVLNQAVQFNLNVDGGTSQRVYSTAGDNGPITVKATATLDGKPIDPSAVVNKTGLLTVSYLVTNTSAQQKAISYKDSTGALQTATYTTADPIGGTLDVVLPQGFNEITARGATLGGDGQGATKASFSMVLFPPLGEPTATLTYEARINNGTLPPVTFTFVPIVPLENSTISSTKDAYKSGAESGAKIADAGVQIGDNLVKLQDGAGLLMSGLIEAANGAQALATGLNGTAVPGANALASGLAGGIPDAQRLADGSAELAASLAGGIPGAKDLAAGFPAAVAGSQDIANAAKPTGSLGKGLLALQAGVNALPDNIGEELQDPTGDFQTQVIPAFDILINGGIVDIPQPNPLGLPAHYPLPPAAQLIDISGAVPSGDLLTPYAVCGVVPGCQTAVINAAVYILYGSGLATNAVAPPTNPRSLQALVLSVVASIKAGLLGGSPSTCIPGGTNPATACSINFLVQSVTGTTPVQGQPTLSMGASALAAGLAEAAPGIAGLPGSLTDAYNGAHLIADGNAKVVVSLGTAADGATALASGLATAGDGAQTLATGLAAAPDGAGKIADGAGQLKIEGADALVTSGQEAEADFASKVAQIDAAQVSGLEGAGIPFGKATTSTGEITTTGVYQMTLAAATTPEENNAVRYGLALLALIIAVGLGTVLWQRRSA